MASKNNKKSSKKWLWVFVLPLVLFIWEEFLRRNKKVAPKAKVTTKKSKKK